MSFSVLRTLIALESTRPTQPRMSAQSGGYGCFPRRELKSVPTQHRACPALPWKGMKTSSLTIPSHQLLISSLAPVHSDVPIQVLQDRCPSRALPSTTRFSPARNGHPCQSIPGTNNSFQVVSCKRSNSSPKSKLPCAGNLRASKTTCPQPVRVLGAQDGLHVVLQSTPWLSPHRRARERFDFQVRFH